MMARSLRPTRSALLMACLLISAGAWSQTAEPTVRVRGIIEGVEGTMVTVKARDGSSVPIKLRDNWAVSGIKKASLEDIKPGMFIGTAAAARGGDALQALEVLIFPPGVKSNEGHSAWDLLPESTMTNATVASTIADVRGPVLLLTYPGGEKKVAVTPDTPIVTIAPAEKSDVKPGAPVFIPAQRAADGTLSTMRIVVGNNGVAPPM